MTIKRTTNGGVAESWAKNEKARSNNGNFSTDGDILYSYNTMIGFTSEEGRKVVLDYTAGTGNFLSMTTSTKHLPPAKGVCNVVLNPTHFQNTDKNF